MHAIRLLALLVALNLVPQRLGISLLPTTSPSPGAVLEVADFSCAGVFLSPGLVSGGTTTSYPTTMRYEGGTRHYFTYAGDGHIYEYPEPTLSPCNTAPASMNRASVEGWGGDWGLVTANASGGYQPGCDVTNPNCSTYAFGLNYDPTLDSLLLSWSGTYSNVGAHNSVATLALNNSAHTLSTSACWGLSAIPQLVSGSGVLQIPSAFVAAHLPTGARYGVGFGFEFGTIGGGISEGLSLYGTVPPSSNACAADTDYSTSSFTLMSNYGTNDIGPTCASAGLGCTPSQAPTTPYPQQAAYTNYSFYMYQPDWDPYGGHGWVGFAASAGVTWYDDGVKHGIVMPMLLTEGWASTTVSASTSPTAFTAASTSTHDGLNINPGDVIWVTTCTSAIDGPGCDGGPTGNNEDKSFGPVTAVNTSTGAITWTPTFGDGGNGTSGHLPVPGASVWHGCVYAHGEPQCSRGTYRMQIFDPNVYAQVIAGSIQSYEPVASDDQEIDTTLMTTFGSPSAGSGVGQGSAATSIVGTMSDPTAQQVIVVTKNGLGVGCCAPAVQMFVLNVSHTPSPFTHAPQPIDLAASLWPRRPPVRGRR